MATEADISVPICETRGEQVENFVDNIINISVSKLSLEKQTRDDKFNEHPTVEGENFLRPPSTGEVHSEVYNVSPDVSKVTEEADQAVKDSTDTLLLSTKLEDQPVEAAASEETSEEQIQKHAEESNSTEKDGDIGTDSSVVISEMRVGDTVDDPDADEARVVTQLSKDTSSDHHGTNVSFTENIALTKEILQETSLPSEETESHAPSIPEGEELIVQAKTTDNKSEDVKPTEEDMSCNFTSEVSNEGESDQNKSTSEQETLTNETSVENNSNTAAEEVRQENSTSTETTTTLESSNSDELQSKNDLNSSSSKEEETVATSEDHGVPLENTLSESHEDVECQPKTLNDAATDHSDPELAEKSEESLFVQVEESQIGRDEHLEEESERLPLTEVSTTDNVKDKDEDLKEAELFENEPSTRCTSLKEDMKIETPAESLHVAAENIEVSDLRQENSIEGPPEEQSTKATLHGNTFEAEEATTDAVDREKESLESCPPVVSSPSKDGSMNAILQDVTSVHTDEKLIDEVNKHTEVLENISVDEAHSEINNVTEKFDQTVRDGTDTLLLSPKLDDQPVEFAANEQTSVEEIHQNAEESNSTEKDGDRGVVLEQCSTDSSVVTSEMNAGDTLDDPYMDDARVVTQLSKDTSSDHHGTNDSFTENIALTKEILEETIIPSVETESHAPCISEGEELNVQVSSDNKSEEVKPTDEDLSSNLISEVSKEGESDQNKMTSEQEALENERSVEDTSNIVAEAISQENSTSTDTITTLETCNNDELQSNSDLNSSFCKEEETTAEKGDRSVTTTEDYGVTLENTLSESHGDEECQSKTLEDTATDHSEPKLAEKYEESSLVQIEDSQIECDEHLEKESERLTLTEASTGGTNDNVSEAIDKVKDEDEDLKEVELSENEQSTRCTLVKEDEQIEHSAESLHVAPESTEVFDLRQENNIKGPLEEQSTNATLHGNTIEAEEATIDAVYRQKESHESFPPILSSSPEDGVLQEVTSDHTDEKTIDDVDKHTEVLENLSIGEAHSEINNVAPDISEVTEKSDQTVRDDTDTLLSSPILDDQSTEFAANEETYVEEIQQNAEESNSTEKDGDKGVVPEQCSTDSSVVTSEMKAGDTLDDPDVDDARVVTQLSKDTSSDRHGTNESFTENIALTKEILQETESHAPCIPEGEGLNIQVKTTDNKSEAEKPTEEENLSCNLTSEVSKEEESDQNKMTSEQEALANERGGEDNSNTAPEEVSQENCTSTETITTLETSNIDELQSKSDLNSSFSNEEETTVQKGDRSVDVATEDSGFLLENTLSESHGDEECQSKTLEDAATDHSDPKLAEQSEESSHGQVDASQIERDEQLEEESERLLLTEASTGGTNDNVSEAIDKVKDEGQDLKEVELSEIEQSTRCTSVKEDVQIEHSAESLHVAPKSTEVFDLSQENNIKGLLEEHSTDSNLHKNSIEEEETTINEVVDQQKECLESFQPIVSSSPEEGSMTAVLQEVTRDHADNIIEEVDKHTEVLENLSTTADAEGNSLIKLEGSENKNEDDLGKESENTSLPLPLAREVSDESKFLNEAQFEDGESKKVELCDNERSTESMSLKTESSTDNTKDSLHVTSEDNKAPDLGQEIETRSAIEDKDLSTPPQGMLDKRSESEIVDAAETKEETLENVPTIVSNEEHLEKENLEVSLIKDNTGNANNEVVIVKDVAKIEDGNLSGAELFDKDKKPECVLLTEEVQSEKPVESLHATFEDVKAADFDHHTEATGILQEQIPVENSQGIASDETEWKVIDAANTIEKTQELQNVSNEESEKGLLIEGNASEAKLGTNLEEETERPSLTEASKEDPNDEEEKSRDLKEKLQNAPEDHKTSTSSEDRKTTLSLEEQSLAENSQAIISNTIIDEAGKELALENVATQIPHDHIEENLETQVDWEHEQHLEKDIQNSSFTEAPIEETNTNTNTRESNEPKTGVEDSIKSELENEENTESTNVQEEEDVEKPGDIKQHDSSLDINNSIEGIEEQIPTTDPREISSDDTEREPVDVANTNEESLEDIAKSIPDCDQDENISVEEVSSQKPSKDASAGSANDEESPENTEGGLIKEEDSIDSLQVAAQDIDTPTLGQDTEQSSITNSEGIIDDNKEDIADNADGSEDETLKDKNTANTTLYEDKEENLQVQEDCSRLEQNDNLGNDRENAPFGEAPTVYTTESSPVREEEQVEKHVEEPILTVDAANERNDVVVNVPNEDNSPIEVDGSQKLSCEEVPAEKINDDEPTAIHEATDEDIKATSSVQDREASHLEEQAPTTDSPGTTGDHNDTKTLHLADPKEETVEDKNYATIPYEGTKEDSLIQVDGSLTSLTDAPKGDTTESILVREVAQVEDPIDSLHAATEDIKAFAPSQDTGISSTDKQIQDPEDISSNKITEKTIEATGEEIQDAEDIAKSVPHEEDSPNVEDGSQKPSLVEGLIGNFDEHESTMHKVEFVDESFIKADLLESEKNTEATLIKEDVSIELPQVAAEDIKEPCLSEVRETNSEEEQILSANPGGLVDDNKTIDPIVFQKEIPKEEVPKEIESVDVKATPIELKEEEGYLKDLQMTTAVNLVAAHQEKSSNLTSEKPPSAEGLNVNEDVIGHNPEVSDYMQHESSITQVSEEHMTTSNEHVSDNASLESEVSEKNNGQVVGEEDSPGDKTDLEKIKVLDDGFIAVPTNETLAETDPRGSSEAEVPVPNGEKDAELTIHEAEIDKKNIKEALLHNVSDDVSESEEVNDEEKTDSVASQKVSTSNVALEEDSTSNSSQEPRREAREKTETGEAQKQESELQDSSVEKIERDAQLCLASANDSGINEEVQKLKEDSLPAPEENIVETTDRKESDAVEGAINNKDIDHLEQSDTTKSFSDDKKPTEEELEETVANDVLPVSSSETPGVDHSTTERELTNREEPCTDKTATGDDEEIKIDKGDNDEKEACDEKISDISSAAPDMIEARDTDAAKSTNNSDSIIDTTEGPTINENTGVECILVNERSVTDLETKNDDEAPEIKETTPSSAEGQDVESASVEENSNYLTEEKSDSNEVAFAPGENISGYESNNRVLESIAQVQSCDIISETEETKIEEENLKAEAEIPKDEVPKEIEIVDVKETPIELKEEEGYLKDLQMTTAANLVAAHQEKSSNITFGKTPYAEDLDANEDVIGYNPEVSHYKQHESSITKVSEEHMTTSNEHVSDNASLESEVSEKNNDQVDGEEHSCGDKTDSEKVEVLNDGSIAVPTNETLEETDPRGSIEAEVSVPNGEKDAELTIQDEEIDQKNINEALLHNASEDVSESEEVNGEEKTNSVASQEVSTSNVALEEDLTSKSSQEPRRETRENTETEEAQKQESVLQDPSMQKIERDAQSYLASANDSGITEEVQKLQEVPLPAPEENIVETTDCKESDVVEGATNNEDIDHPEQSDTTKSFSDDKKPTEEELEETVANDVLPVSSSETPGVDHSTTERELTNREEPCTEKTATGDDEEIKIDKGENDEKEACEEKISDISSTAPDIIEARDTDVSKLTNNSDSIIDTTEGPMINENASVECILVNERSVTDLDTKNDDEASEIKETTPSSAEGQDVESASVEENSNYPGSLTKEKSDSNEVAFAPGENISGYESNNQVLESIAQVQSCDIISETEETKTEEENLKAEAEIKSDKAVAEDIFEQEETTCEKEILKDNISSEKEQLLRSEAEDEDIKDYDRGSCEEEVITDSNQEEVVKQEQQKTIKETVEFIKNGNETETVAKVSEEADDKAPKDLEEKVLINEAIDRILHQEAQGKSIEGPTTKLDAEKAHELDVASVKTDTRDSNQEGVHIAIIPDEESEEQNNKDEICSSDKVQAKHEENVVLSEGKSEEEAKEIDIWTKPNEDGDKETYVEAKKLDFASQTKGISECVVSDGAQDIPEDNGNSTTKDKFSGEDYPSKSTEFEVSSASEDISLTEQASEATVVTAEVQEAKAGIDLGASVPTATGIESRKVEEENDECAAMADTSTPVEPPVISTSKIIPCTVETPLHVSEDVQELRKESFEVSKHENPVEGDPEEKIESSEGQETKPIQNAPVSETLEQETEQQELGRGTEDVHEEQNKIYNIPNQLESSYGAEKEKVPESSICQSSVEDTAQHDENEGSRQIDPPAFLPQAQCSDIKTSEKGLPVHVAGLDSVGVAELEAPPLPLKDKHVVLEADDTRNLNPEDLGGNKNISTEYSQGEHEIVKPSKVEQEEAECGNEERTDQEREGKAEPKETGKSSLSDLFHVSMRGMADHSATEKEAHDLHAEHSDEAEHENSKTDDEEGSHEQRRSDSGSEAPVMVDMADEDVKVAHKKSHSILSGVGSKVKHSIAKVKKAITGKSSHTKPPSPKKVTN